MPSIVSGATNAASIMIGGARRGIHHRCPSLGFDQATRGNVPGARQFVVGRDSAAQRRLSSHDTQDLTD
jgi:hypothetical protein